MQKGKPTLTSFGVMQSFKVYLPSNACQLIYPNNKPSDYKTRLDHSMRLEGEWEVGVESIFYSRIDDKHKQAQVQCNVKALKEAYRTIQDKANKFAFKSVLKWKRNLEILPIVFEKDPTNIEFVISTLNLMNHLLVTSKNFPAFSFTTHSFYTSSSLKKFYIFMTPRLAGVLLEAILQTLSLERRKIM